MSDYQYPKLEDDGTMILREGYNLTSAGAPANPDDADARKGIKTFYQTQRVEIKRLKHPPETKINGPGDVYKVLQNIGDLDREHVFLLHLNRNGEITGIEEIAVGTAAYAPIHPRELVKGAVIDSANAVIFVHNHPSGSLEFSSMDTEVARSSQIAFQIYGIPLLDFMIITRDGFTSMKERGLLPFDRSEMMLSFDTLIRGIAEGTDPDKEPTDNDIKCDLAVMIAKETLAENCRRPDLPSRKMKKLHYAQTFCADAVQHLSGQGKASAFAKCIKEQMLTDGITLSGAELDKYLLSAEDWLKVSLQPPSPTKDHPPGVSEGALYDELKIKEAYLARIRRQEETSASPRLAVIRDFIFKEASHESIDKCFKFALASGMAPYMQDSRFYDCMEKEMQKVRSKTLSPSENPEFTPVRIPQYEHSGPS